MKSETQNLCSYFEKQIKIIDAITFKSTTLENNPFDTQINLYKKTLLITMLDAISNLRWNIKDNKKRFIQTLETDSQWKNGNLVNVPFLFDQLFKKEHQKNKSSKLKVFLEERLSSFNNNDQHQINIITIDLSKNTLLDLAETMEEKKCIIEYQHYAILYRYRNYLVHEAREPGYGMEISIQANGYYHRYLNDKRWFLVYPLELIKTICLNCVKGLEKYLIEHKINIESIIDDTTRF